MDLQTIAGWATVLTAIAALFAWVWHRTPALAKNLRSGLERRQSERFVKETLESTYLNRLEHDHAGIVLRQGLMLHQIPTDHQAWNTLMRRRLVCPSPVESRRTGKSGLLKRVLTSDTEPIMFEVVASDGEVERWLAVDVAFRDELSMNAEIVEAYRRSREQPEVGEQRRHD